MIALIQRVSESSVFIASECVAAIEQGVLVLLGVEKTDEVAAGERLADRILAYRIFPDQDDKMNLSVQDIAGGVLVVSQFTLAADTRKGLRPSFSSAAAPEVGQRLYDHFVDYMRSKHDQVASGRFGADMKVSLVNDGPVSFILKT